MSDTTATVSLPQIPVNHQREPLLYLLVNGQPSGPISRSELVARVQRGEIDREILCATAGADTWVRVGDVVPPPVKVTSIVAVRILSAVILFFAAPLMTALGLPFMWMYVAWILAFVILIFTPIAVATKRQHPSRTAITILSLLLGWTLVGWIVAMCWSLSGADRK